MSFLVTNKPLTLEECIVWARLQFERDYNNDIRQLLFSLPKDSLTSTGQPFWSGPKRAPDPLVFNSNDVSLSSMNFSNIILNIYIHGLANSFGLYHFCRQSACF